MYLGHPLEVRYGRAARKAGVLELMGLGFSVLGLGWGTSAAGFGVECFGLRLGH